MVGLKTNHPRFLRYRKRACFVPNMSTLPALPCCRRQARNIRQTSECEVNERMVKGRKVAGRRSVTLAEEYAGETRGYVGANRQVSAYSTFNARPRYVVEQGSITDGGDVAATQSAARGRR